MNADPIAVQVSLMCGRYGRIRPLVDFQRKLGLDGQVANEPPNYNAHPGIYQFIHAPWPRAPADQPDFIRALWGFVPSWARNQGRKPINARIESAPQHRFWRKAFAKRRCVIPADFWYEWRDEGRHKQPYLIRPADTQGFFFAGIWSMARSLPESDMARHATTFAILTTPAHADIAHIHPRMPVALTDAGARAWLAATEDQERLRAIIGDATWQGYEAGPVSTAVNMPSNNTPELVEPMTTDR